MNQGEQGGGENKAQNLFTRFAAGVSNTNPRNASLCNGYQQEEYKADQ